MNSLRISHYASSQEDLCSFARVMFRVSKAPFRFTKAHLPSTAGVQRRGKKLLVLDPNISAYLGLLTEITLLREHGVER